MYEADAEELLKGATGGGEQGGVGSRAYGTRGEDEVAVDSARRELWEQVGAEGGEQGRVEERDDAGMKQEYREPKRNGGRSAGTRSGRTGEYGKGKGGVERLRK